MRCLINKQNKPSTVLKTISFKTVAGHNACGHELSEIMSQFDWLKLEFPFNKQFIFIPEISTITHRENALNQNEDSSLNYKQIPSIEIGYTMLDGSKKSIELNSIRQIRRVDILKSFQSNNQLASKPQEVPSSQPDLQSLSQPQQQQKQPVIVSPQTPVTSQQSQQSIGSAGNRGMNSGGGIVVSDGLYFLGDFAKSKEVCLKGSALDSENQQMEAYMERLLESFNKELILQFLHYYLTTSLLSLLKNNRPVDVDESNFLLLRQGTNVRFIFLLSVDSFVLEFEDRFEEFNRIQASLPQQQQHNTQQQNGGGFNYGAFKKQFTESKVNSLRELNEKLVEILLSSKEREEQFSKKFIQQIFGKTSQKHSIPNAICLLEQRKRYNWFFLPHNTVLNLIMNSPGVRKEVEQLILLEKQQTPAFSSGRVDVKGNLQLALVNYLLKNILPKYSNREGNILAEDKPSLYTEVGFVCEQASVSAQDIQSKSSTATSAASAGTKAPVQTPTSGSAQSIGGSSNKLEQQDQQQTRTSQSVQSYTNNVLSALQLDEVKELNLTFFVIEKQSSRNKTPSQSEQPQQQQQQQQSSAQMQQQQQQAAVDSEKFSFRTVEKRIAIGMNEQKQNCSMKLSIFQAISSESNADKAEMSMSSDIIDEVYYVLQILNNAFSDFTLKIDEMRKLGFHMNFTLNRKSSLLTRVIYAIDILVISGLIFHDFFFQHIVNSKSTRDSSKYKLIQYELEHALLAYKLRFSRFEEYIESLNPRNE